MNTTLENAAAEYLDAVRAALADLPDDELSEIVEDVAEHLEQVAAELGGNVSTAALEQRLGAPDAYAAELRSAAGFPEAAPAPRGRPSTAAALRFVVTWLLRGGAVFGLVGGLIMAADGHRDQALAAYLLGAGACTVAAAVWLLVRGRREPVAALRELPDVRRAEIGIAALKARPLGSAAIDFVASLRTGWWLLRAWVATQLIMAPLGEDFVFPIPRTPVAIAVLLATVLGSIWLGRRAVMGVLPERARLAQLAGNAALTALTPVVIAAASFASGYTYVVYEDPYYDEGLHFEGFYHEDGTEIVNLYVYDDDGRLLDGVRIYDQDGRPVENVAPWKWHECIEQGGWYPGGPQGNVFPRPAVYFETEPARCAAPVEAAPFGASLPGSAASVAGDAESEEVAGSGEVTEPGGAEETDPSETEPAVVEPGTDDDR